MMVEDVTDTGCRAAADEIGIHGPDVKGKDTCVAPFGEVMDQAVSQLTARPGH